MKKTLYVALLLLAGFYASAQPPAGFRVVGYVPTWKWSLVSSLDYTKLTHINVAFVNPTDNQGTLSAGQNLSTLVSNAHANSVEVLASIGGASGPLSYYQTLLQDANRPAFIDSLVKYMNDNNLDGIDVDLEGNALNIDEYGVFIQELADTLHQEGKLVTAAVAQWNGDLIPDAALDSFDFINLMAYDATGPWDPGNPGPHSPYSKATTDINYWRYNRGVPQDKIVLGVPFYGYEFFGTYATAMTYDDIVTTYPGAEWKDKHGDLYYNGIPTIEDKTALAMSTAKGIMIWELGQDAPDPYSLLTTIDNRLNGILSVNESHDDAKTLLFPNPATNVITITSVVAIKGYSVSNGLGENVMEYTVPTASSTKLEVGLASLSPGMYVIHINLGTTTVVKQFIKI